MPVLSPNAASAGLARDETLLVTLLSRRWTLLILRALMDGPHRFVMLAEHLPGISRNLLAQRLQELELSALVQRRRLPAPADVQIYELTPWGEQGAPVFQALSAWAAASVDLVTPGAGSCANPHADQTLPESGDRP